MMFQVGQAIELITRKTFVNKERTKGGHMNEKKNLFGWIFIFRFNGIVSFLLFFLLLLRVLRVVVSR